MSVTYSVAKEAAAIAAANGEIYYALFERTYESNVHPHTPHWCAIYFGTAKACMQKLILWSSACEGGSLQEPGGRTTPSAYLKHWREALASPAALPAQRLQVLFGDKSLYKVGAEQRPALEAVVHASGLNIEGETLHLALPDHARLLQALIDAGLSAWKALDRPAAAEPAPWAAYAPPAVKAALQPITVYFAQHGDRDREHWVVHDSGESTHTGWAYSTIGALICRYAIAAEAEQPGSAESVMRQIRHAVEVEARPLAAEQIVVVDPAHIAEDWQLRQYRHLCDKLHKPQDAGRIECGLGEILAAGALYELGALDAAAVTFVGLTETANHAAYPHAQLDLMGCGSC